MKENKFSKAGLLLFLIAVIIAGISISIYYFGQSITGFAVKESSYADTLNLVVASSGNYTWHIGNIGGLKSVKIDGKMTNYGRAKVYLESNGIKYLMFDSARLNKTDKIKNESANLITGFAVKEDKDNKNKTESDKDKKNNKPKWISEIELFVLNKTLSINLSQYFVDEENDTLAFSVSDAENIIESMDGDILNLSATLDNFNSTITIIASDGNLSASKEIKLIAPLASTINITPAISKTMIINLAYKSGTIYDTDDNGEESINGVVDLTVEGTSFSWDVGKSKLCTRWEVYNIEAETLTTFCSGNNECCAFAGLLSRERDWSNVYYLTLNKDGAGYNNIVSSRIIYYDVNLSLYNLKSEIYYSEWANKSVKFFEEEIEFLNACLETCSLTGLNKSSYILLFEIEGNAVLKIDRAKYTILASIVNKPPLLLQNFSTINVPKNKNITINLLQYFADPDGDILNYNYYKVDDITILFENDIATILPNKDFEGAIFTYITANDSENYAVSNVFMINISEVKTRLTCSCPESGNWNGLFSDKCVIATDCDMKGNNITITGNGTWEVDALIYNYNKIVSHGGTIVCRRANGCFG